MNVQLMFPVSALSGLIPTSPTVCDEPCALARDDSVTPECVFRRSGFCREISLGARNARVLQTEASEKRALACDRPGYTEKTL